MNAAFRYRSMVADVRRVVVKIGTRVLVQKTGRPDKRCMRRLVKDLADLHHNGYEVLVVSSGAVGAGMESLGMKTRPEALPDIQMSSSV